MKPCLIASLILLTTCTHRVQLQTADGPGWTAEETRKDQWLIFAGDDQARRDALDQICSPKHFICAVAPAGTVTAVARTPKGTP